MQKHPKKFIRNDEITGNFQLNLVKSQEICKLEYNNVLQLCGKNVLSDNAAKKKESFYVARNANVTFSDIQLTTNGISSASGSGLKAAWNKLKDVFPF